MQRNKIIWKNKKKTQLSHASRGDGNCHGHGQRPGSSDSGRGVGAVGLSSVMWADASRNAHSVTSSLENYVKSPRYVNRGVSQPIVDCGVSATAICMWNYIALCED